MKLSDENRKRQRAIVRAIASGKGVRGLLAGLVAATTAVFASGCRKYVPMGRMPMGDYPKQQVETNSPGKTCEHPKTPEGPVKNPAAKSAPKKTDE